MKSIDLTKANSWVVEDVDAIVSSLVANVSVNASQLMLVGAQSRDILHSALGHQFPVRSTSDADLAIAVRDHSVLEQIQRTYKKSGNTGIRFEIASMPVDMILFGEVEDPAGITRIRNRNEDLVVFGFADVYQRALPLTLPSGNQIKIPHPAGYAALKLRAWLDRSPDGQYRDAEDLALVAYWYQKSSEVADRLFGDESLSLVNFDLDLNAAAVGLLGVAVAGQLSTSNLADLSQRWQEQKTSDLFERYFTVPQWQQRTAADLERYRDALIAGAGFSGK